MKKSRLNFRINSELKEWFQKWAEDHGGMTDVIEKYLRELKSGEETMRKLQ